MAVCGRNRLAYTSAMNSAERTEKPQGPLRRGWTTGACATAATKAALTALLTGRFPDPVSIRLPKGETPAFALAYERLADGEAEAAIVKDAGDDPDVTHGATIIASVRLGAAGTGIVFRAGDGVGTVTKPGLPVGVGEPAINPVPRAMIRAEIETLCAAHGVAPDIEITISVPGGEQLAEKTWNPRLGIVGGISILGTTGIVHPYSCSAWIHSIHRGIDVARASGIDHVLAATGSTSEAAARRLHDFADIACLDMGDFAGGRAEVSACPSGGAADACRRLRQDRQAGAGFARSAFGPQPGRLRPVCEFGRKSRLESRCQRTDSIRQQRARSA